MRNACCEQRANTQVELRHATSCSSAGGNPDFRNDVKEDLEWAFFKGSNVCMCSHCCQKGHLEKLCLKEKKDEKRAKKNATDEFCGLLHVDKAMLTSHSDSWVVVSGATSHVTFRRDWFQSFSDCCSQICIGTNSTITVRGSGMIPIFGTPDDKRYFSQVLYVPDLTVNILSVSALTKEGAVVELGCNSAIIRDHVSGHVLARGVQEGGLYKIFVLNSLDALWHARYGHLNLAALHKAHRMNMVEGLPALRSQQGECKSCLRVKEQRTTFPDEATRRATKPLELVHSKLCGPMSTASLKGSQYMLIFVDDFSRYSWAYFLQYEDQTFATFCEWKLEVERQCHSQVKILRCKRSPAYTSQELSRYLNTHSIQRQVTVTHNARHREVADRKNISIIEMGRTMLEHQSLERKFWAEAASTAVYIMNRSPTFGVQGMTPYEAFTRTKPSVFYFRVFGCTAYVHASKEHHECKSDTKLKPHIFMGYSSSPKAYRLFDPDAGTIVIRRDVVFNEESPSLEGKRNPTVFSSSTTSTRVQGMCVSAFAVTG